jgi:hypothetical protein
MARQCAYPSITSSERDVLAVALNIQETFGSMANFVAIVDPDDGRRLRFQHAVQPLLAVLDGLATSWPSGRRLRTPR